METIGPLLWHGAVALLLVGTILIVSYFLGERREYPATHTPYESGVVSTGHSHPRFSVQFYLVAVFFVIFDLEAAFLFAWAAAWREVGWRGWWEAAIFVGVLLAGLFYLCRNGGLNWNQPAPIRPVETGHPLQMKKRRI